MEIRELKARDIKTLAKMLGKLKTTSVGDLFELLDKKKTNQLEVGLSIFRIVAADLTDDIYTWLADLIGKTPAELDEMPASTPGDIIKTLIERGDFKSFFGQATRQAVTTNSPDTTT